MENVEKFIPKNITEKAPEKAPEKDLPESEEKLPPNVKIVETEKAKFRIAYGKHITERKPEELGKADALMLESSSFDYTLSKELVEKEFNRDIGLKEEIQYRKIIKRAEEEKRPIFLGDITEADAVIAFQLGLKDLEPKIGLSLLGVLLASLVAEKLTREKLTRREFLKGSLAIAGAYLLSEAPKGAIRYLFEEEGILDEKSAPRAIERFLGDLNERIHPETNAIIFTLRNHLMAQKLKTVSEKLEIKNRKPEVALMFGAYHHGIEGALKEEDEERIWLIDKLLSVPGLKDTREKIATIARFDFNKDKDKWELTDRFKDPHLAKIEK